MNSSVMRKGIKHLNIRFQQKEFLKFIGPFWNFATKLSVVLTNPFTFINGHISGRILPGI